MMIITEQDEQDEFNHGNTEGYSDEQLNRANNLLNRLVKTWDKDDFNYPDEIQNLSEKILNHVGSGE